jgi:hypothetical protein
MKIYCSLRHTMTMVWLSNEVSTRPEEERLGSGRHPYTHYYKYGLRYKYTSIHIY